ncbi:hypothetical protein N7456_006212 [Penicillium angulare]|uniref:Uncharacterized protein n=1 Tax=Penicillium angulare TaxID=116970 RepID=A0A9W9G1I2_9EURO|nr:hypothetical protein N7456_006212 [Penicillium angulare]
MSPIIGDSRGLVLPLNNIGTFRPVQMGWDPLGPMGIPTKWVGLSYLLSPMGWQWVGMGATPIPMGVPWDYAS